MGSKKLRPSDKFPVILGCFNRMKHKTARKHRSRKHRSRKHQGGKWGASERRITNLIEQLKLKTGELNVVNQELSECKRALAHCQASNRPLPCPPCPPRSTLARVSRSAEGARGVSPPLSEMEYEVPRSARAATVASPVEFRTHAAVLGRPPRAAATIRRRRNTPSVSTQAQTYGPTPRNRNRTRRGSRTTVV